MQAPENRIHLLMLGAPRSGTTLLASMVGRHTEVGLTIEDMGRSFGRIASKQVVGNKLCIPNHIELRRRRNAAKRFCIRKPLRMLGVLRLWKKMGVLEEFYYGSDLTIEDYLRLPNIKMILITRHGDDVISSITKRSTNSAKIARKRWIRAVSIMHELKQRLGECALVVAFENLVEDPDSQMRRICKFLELPFQQEMLEGYKYNLIYPGEQKIDRDRADRHLKNNLSFDLDAHFPEVWALYEELKAFASG